MVEVLQEACGLPEIRLSAGGCVDSARFRHFLAEEMNVSRGCQRVRFGWPRRAMVPVVDYTTVAGINLPCKMGWISEQRIEVWIARAKAGNRPTAGTGSAYAPASSAIAMADAYLKISAVARRLQAANMRG